MLNSSTYMSLSLIVSDVLCWSSVQVLTS